VKNKLSLGIGFGIMTSSVNLFQSIFPILASYIYGNTNSYHNVNIVLK